MLTSLWTGLGFLPPLPFSSRFLSSSSRAALFRPVSPLSLSPSLPCTSHLASARRGHGHTSRRISIFLRPTYLRGVGWRQHERARRMPFDWGHENRRYQWLMSSRPWYPPRWIEKLISRVHRTSDRLNIRWWISIFESCCCFFGGVGEGSFFLKLVKIVF